MDATTLEVESSAEKTSINPPNDIFFRLEEIDEVHQARRSPVDTVGRTTVQGSYALRDIPTTWRAADLLRGMVPNLPQFREERPFLEKPVREDVWNPWGANDFYTIYLAFYIRSLFSSNLERHRFLEKVQPQQGVLLALSAQRTSTAVDPQVPRRDTQPFRSQVLEVRRRLKGYEHLVRTLTALAQQRSRNSRDCVAQD
jgi:hypothetical protein